MIATKQSNGDSGEAILRRKALVISIPIAEHFVDCNHTGQSAGYGHREHNLFFNRDAAIFGRIGVRAGGTDFVSPLRPPQEDVHKSAREDCNDESHIQRNARRNSRDDLADTRDVCAVADGQGFENRITLLLEICLRQSARDTHGNEIHHDRIDDFMRTKSSFQHTRNSCPKRSTGDGYQTRERNEHPCRTIREGNSGPGRGKCRDGKLAFSTNVQQPATESHSDGQSGKDERRRIEQRVADAVWPRQGAADEERIRLYWIVANKRDEDAADKERCEDSDEGKCEFANQLHKLSRISRTAERC